MLDSTLETYSKPLLSLIQRRLDRGIRSRVSPEDVLQDVLLEISRRFDSRCPSIPVSVWVRKIARDRIIDAHRKHTAVKRSVNQEETYNQKDENGQTVSLAEQTADVLRSPLEQLLTKELTQTVKQAISRLEERDIEILVLRYYQQLSNQETSQILGLTPFAASMRLNRSIKRLKTLIN